MGLRLLHFLHADDVTVRFPSRPPSCSIIYIMGAAASLPASIDRATARLVAGEKFDEAAFDAAAIDGHVSRDVFLKAGGVDMEASVTKPKGSESQGAWFTRSLSSHKIVASAGKLEIPGDQTPSGGWSDMFAIWQQSRPRRGFCATFELCSLGETLHSMCVGICAVRNGKPGRTICLDLSERIVRSLNEATNEMTEGVRGEQMPELGTVKMGSVVQIKVTDAAHVVFRLDSGPWCTAQLSGTPLVMPSPTVAPFVSLYKRGQSVKLVSLSEQSDEPPAPPPPLPPSSPLAAPSVDKPAAATTPVATPSATEASVTMPEQAPLDDACAFFFVAADYIRAHESDLPVFQEMQRQGLLQEEIIALSKVVCASYRERVLVVSHRWETVTAPDPKREQLRVLKEHLAAHPKIERVWIE